jgi:hypothetical protein
MTEEEREAEFAQGDHDDGDDSGLPEDDARRVLPKLGIGYDELSKLVRAVVRTAQDRSPLGQEVADRVVDSVFRLLNRREVVQRILRSEFMASVREMQSEITESVGIASQSDVQEIKSRLDDVIVRMDKLQKTLDEIVVEVEDA